METCDKPQRLDQVLQITGNHGSFNLGSEPPISFEDVRSEIDNGRVVCSRVGLFGGGGHFQMIIGWKIAGGEQYLVISDPIYSETEIAFSSFASRYEGPGEWNVAYITAPVMADAPPVGIVETPGAPADLFVASITSLHPADIIMASAIRVTTTDAGLLAESDESAALFGG